MEFARTDRLILRSFLEKDSAGLFMYLHEPRARCFFDLRLDTIEDAEKEVEKRALGGEYLAVCLKDTDELIGDLFCIFEEPDTYSVGWNFNEVFGGLGYATEAVRALFDVLFLEKNARRIYAYAEDYNAPSRRLCEKLGMRQEGLFKEYVSFGSDPNGDPIFENTMQYAILKKEWIT